MTEAEGADDGQDDQQTCTRCGHDFPSPVELHHSEQDCEQLCRDSGEVEAESPAAASPTRLLPAGAELHLD